MSISLSHLLCGILGFLVGSAGAGGAVYGAKKRNPLSFALGLLFCLSGVAIFFSSLIFKAAVEDALSEADEETAAEEEESAPAEEEAEAVPEEEPAAEEEAAPAEEEPAPEKESDEE